MKKIKFLYVEVEISTNCTFGSATFCITRRSTGTYATKDTEYLGKVDCLLQSLSVTPLLRHCSASICRHHHLWHTSYVAQYIYVALWELKRVSKVNGNPISLTPDILYHFFIEYFSLLSLLPSNSTS